MIAGAKRADQVNDNVAADAVELTPETLASINVLTAG